VIDISGHDIPSMTAIHVNAHALARYAALCQAAQIVPIVEPEVLMDGDHDIDRCYAVTQRVLNKTFQELRIQRVALEGMILKPNMVVSGKKSAKQASVAEVAEKTIRLFEDLRPLRGARHRLLSGGQSDEDATAHLDAINRIGGLPWRVTFSYGRALQAAPRRRGRARRKRRRCPAGLHPSRADEFAREQGRMAGRSGSQEGGIDLATKPAPPRPGAASLSRDTRGRRSPVLAGQPSAPARRDRCRSRAGTAEADRPAHHDLARQGAGSRNPGRGAALLLDGHIELVARAGADGAHLTGIAAMEEALPTLKPDRIAASGA